MKNGMHCLQIISFSASANKLSTIQKMAGEYARLLMEELDPSNLGYIKVITLTTTSDDQTNF